MIFFKFQNLESASSIAKFILELFKEMYEYAHMYSTPPRAALQNLQNFFELHPGLQIKKQKTQRNWRLEGKVYKAGI